jgi:hypothetical protein
MHSYVHAQIGIRIAYLLRILQVHAIADVIGGSLLAMFVLTFWNYCGKELTAIILHPTVGWLFILSICSAFAVAFPRPVPVRTEMSSTYVCSLI